MIYIIKGKNGAGKTFLANKLYDLGYNRSISYTTRSQRENEIQGYDYNFISKEEFETGIKSGLFAEYQYTNGKYYGTPRKNLKDGVILVTSDEFEIEEQYRNKSILFYIDAPLELRYERVLRRGSSEKEIFYRFNQENCCFLNNFLGCFIDNEKENQSLNQIIEYMKNPKFIENDLFIKKQLRKYKQIDSRDELLIFLQFEEFLMRGIYIDKTLNTRDINTIYFKYMKKFLDNKNIKFNQENEGYYVVLNGYKYYYSLEKYKIRREENEENEKEVVE